MKVLIDRITCPYIDKHCDYHAQCVNCINSQINKNLGVSVMPRYIDAEKIEFFACSPWKAIVTKSSIDNIPTADVRENIHGKWEYVKWCEFRCSICGELSNSEPYKGCENFCPNCGADMRKRHNREYGHDGDGVINPAILTIG